MAREIGPPEPGPDPRGCLRLFLGAAPGSAKTYAMLAEAHVLAEQGRDVVVGLVESYGRPRTQDLVTGLEVLPRLQLRYRATVQEEMDLEAILIRRPALVLVDELAHSNVPGSRHEKRWQDVDQIRNAGIDVLSTVNVQHIESLKDVVEHVTGIVVRETVPDVVVESAESIELTDITPEALRKRMRHGNVYPLDRIESALANFFREGNLAALRELAIWYTIHHPSRRPHRPRNSHERVVIVVDGSPSSEGLIRRGVRLARRLEAPAAVVCLARRDTAASIEGFERLSQILGAEFSTRAGRDARPFAALVLAAARGEQATHVVLAAAALRTARLPFRRTPLDRIIRDLPDRDIHVVGRRLGQSDSDHRPPAPATSRVRSELERGLLGRASRGDLRLYLGYAPGVGKTTRMLEEGLRRRSRGTDVVVAAASPRGRPMVEYLLAQLDVVPTLDNGLIDLSRVLERNPSVVLVDDLAHRGLGTDQARHQQTQALLQHGMHVVGTAGVLDLESAAQWRELVGARGPDRLSLPDSFLERADEIELVDIRPELLQERLRTALIWPAEQVPAALQGPFRTEVLESLRDVALRRVAAHTDRRLIRYLDQHRVLGAWETYDRVMVALPWGEPEEARPLLAAGAALAARTDARLVAVTVMSAGGGEARGRERARLESELARLGGELVVLGVGSGVAKSLAQWARDHHVTEIIVSSATSSRKLLGPRPFLPALSRAAGDVDIHVLGQKRDRAG